MTTLAKAQELFFAALDAQNKKQLDVAERLYRETLMLAPDRPSVLNNLATVLLQQDKCAEALACCEHLVSVSPGDAGALNNLGTTMAALGRHHEALQQFDHSLKISPDLAEALSNRSGTLAELGRHAEALDDSRRAAMLAPDRADFQSRLGNALVRCQQPEAAIVACEKALAVDPNCADAYQNRGNARILLGRYAEALEDYARTQDLLPDHPRPYWNEALCRLLLGDFERGWRHYGRGWEIGQRGRSKPVFTQPSWNGDYVDGTLLIWGEQGIGDQILYGSMLEEMQAHARHLVVAVDARLVLLLQRSLPAIRVIALDALPLLPGVDVQVAMGDLGKHLRGNWDSFPSGRRGFLKADEERTKQLRKRFGAEDGLLCGISWRSTNEAVGMLKSMALHELGELIAIPGVRCIDLQYGDTSEERGMLQQKTGLTLARAEDIDNFHDIDGLAALISACDIVISVSNTTVHLAGALGKPTLVMLPYALGRIWYWHEKGDYSPWYPSCLLLRQKTAGEWGPVLDEAIAAVVKQSTGANGNNS
jgi:tetratricopeptide (TPR) repeat protein